MRGSEYADSGFERDGEGESAGDGGQGGVVGETKSGAGREVRAEREGEVRGVAGDDAGEEGEAEDGDWDFGSKKRILVVILSFLPEFQ